MGAYFKNGKSKRLWAGRNFDFFCAVLSRNWLYKTMLLQAIAIQNNVDEVLSKN